jgi:hypothetical protein
MASLPLPEGDLFADAVAEAQRRVLLGHVRHEGELAALDAELAKVESGIDRYIRAFETGAKPETICGTRVKEFGSRATAWRARRQELADKMDEADLTAPTPKELAVVRERGGGGRSDRIRQGSPPKR